jgi:hypothetical protein
MTRQRWIKAVVSVMAAAAVVAYLYDPPWMGGVTSGLRPWEEDPPGTRFRWTAGRGTFFVPSSATSMTLPLRAVFPGPDGTPVTVDVRDDGRLLATIELNNPEAWIRTTVPLKRYAGRRRFRRIDLRVSRVVPPFALGVMTGEVVAR